MSQGLQTSYGEDSLKEANSEQEKIHVGVEKQTDKPTQTNQPNKQTEKETPPQTQNQTPQNPNNSFGN